MTLFPKLTLTQAKLSSTIAWAIVVLFQTIALHFPVRGLPFAVRVGITALLIVTTVVIVYTTISSRIERPDERAAYNNYRANSVLFELVFFLCALYVLFGGKWDWEVLTISRSQIILLFAAINCLHDGAFLLYERFGK